MHTPFPFLVSFSGYKKAEPPHLAHAKYSASVIRPERFSAGADCLFGASPALRSLVRNRSFCLRVFAVTFGAAFLHSLSRLYLPDITLIIRKKASCFICKTPLFSTIIYKLTEFVNKQHLTKLFIILGNNSIQLKIMLFYDKIYLNFL